MEEKTKKPVDATIWNHGLQKNDPSTSGDNQSIAVASITQQKHTVSGLSIIALGYNTCNSWVGISTTLAIAISSGGSVTLIYGILLISIIFACTGSTLAELASVYPTAGGQYHFAAILAPERIRKVTSYACGLMAVCSWIALAASVTILSSQILLSFVAQYHNSFEVQGWQTFCVYVGLATVIAIYVTFALNWMMWIFDIGLAITLSLFLAMMVSCGVRSPTVASANSVWVDFVNNTGWPNGIAFLTGLVTPQFMFLGIDGALHLSEECENPQKVVPKAIMATVVIGFATAFPLAVVLCYYTPDIEAALAGATGFPLYEILKQCLRSDTGATILMGAVMVVGVFAMSASQQTASRMTWTFARDNALVFSNTLGKMHPKLEAPVWSIVFNYVMIVLLGAIYLASSTAFNSFIQSAAVFQQLSFGIPAMLLLYRRRSSELLPENRGFRLPGALGYLANGICVAWTLVSLVIYCLPAALPATASNMNYTAAILGVIFSLGVANWYIHARTKYYGVTVQLNGQPS